MARYTGPKNRLARREGTDLGLKTVGSKSHARLLTKLNILPGQHGQRGRRKTSDYGLQLREKQKVKRIYGILEKQFKNYYLRALKEIGNTGDYLLEQIERRLDNTVYRMGFAPTRALARQLVTHGHVLVDGKKTGIPSFLVKKGMVITLKNKSYEIPAVKKIMEEKNLQIAGWLEKKGPVAKVARMPKREDITEDINEQLIIEFYSR